MPTNTPDASCEQRPQFYEWTFPGAPLRVHISLQVVERIQQSLRAEGPPFRLSSARHRGLLIGNANGSGYSEITDFCPLATGQVTELESAIAGLKDSTHLPLGYFRTHGEESLCLTSDDVSLAKSFFSHPNCVILLIRPLEPGPANAGFFFWDKGEMNGDFCFHEFPFDAGHLRPRNRQATQTRIPEPAKPGAAPSIQQPEPPAAMDSQKVRSTPAGAKVESDKREPAKLDLGKADSAKPEAGKADSGKLETGKIDSDKAEPEETQPRMQADSATPHSPPARAYIAASSIAPTSVLGLSIRQEPAKAGAPSASNGTIRPDSSVPPENSGVTATGAHQHVLLRILPKIYRRHRVLSLVLLFVIASVGFAFGHFWPSLSAGAEVAGRVLRMSPRPSVLGLHAQASDNRVLLSWNHESAAAKSATEGILDIKDGVEEHEVRLDSSELSNALVTYTPKSDDVLFRLQLTGKNSSTAESLRVLRASRREAGPSVSEQTAAQAQNGNSDLDVIAARQAAIGPGKQSSPATTTSSTRGK